MNQFRSLAELPVDSVRAVFTDLDDTLTEHGRIAPSTFDALARLKERGLWTVIVSGRPAGWADCLMRLWPLDAMIFENGAGVIRREGDSLVTNTRSAPEAQRSVLRALFEELQAEIPHLKLATDQPYRLCDFAIDFNEEPPRLTPVELERVLEHLGQARGVTAKLSSIHVNYWCGDHTKVTACQELLESEGKRRGIARENVVFSGDSPNDEPLFHYFENSVGVANVKVFLDRMTYGPKYLTKSPSGAGFEEIVARLLTP